MKVVITYGTFDLFHQGHINILKRAKEMGDYLIVGVTSENYDKSRGKLNVKQSLIERIENVKKSGYADKIIVEEYMGQKIEDIVKYHVDTFVIGSDWLGKFDYLKEYCEVVYLERTKGISSTQLRNTENGILRLGCIGCGRIAKRMLKESKYVSGIDLDYVYGIDETKLKEFAEDNDLKYYSTNFEEFINQVDAVYIATPHLTHYDYAKKAILAKKHVLCEKPMCLSLKEEKELFDLAKRNKVILYEALKTAYAPGFIRLVTLAKSGIIGKIKDVDATFTKLINDRNLREFDKKQGGGSVTELISYPLIGIFKLLGTNYKSVNFYSYCGDSDVDLYTKAVLLFDDSIATANVGIGVKKEGDMVISGTKGYIYVPAPWWKTEYFEIRFEDSSQVEKHFYKFEEDGLRYELVEFYKSILNNTPSIYVKEEESFAISKVIEEYKKNSFNELK